MPTITDAFALAERAHRGQLDKAGHPYIDHPRAVAALLAPRGEQAVSAGLLHDVVEDSDITLAHLRAAGYCELVVGAVESVSWAHKGETYEQLVARAAAHPLGRHVKLADNTHNRWPGRVVALGAIDPDKALEQAIKYATARETLIAAGATLDVPRDEQAVSTSQVPLPCPVLSEAGTWCAKPVHPGWRPWEGHGGGHFWTTRGAQAMMNGGHFDAIAALDGLPVTGHLVEDCPGPGECEFWPYLDRAKRTVVELRLGIRG